MDKFSWAVPCVGYTEPRRFASRMLKKSASREKAEVQVKVERRPDVLYLILNLDLNLSLHQKLRPC